MKKQFIIFLILVFVSLAIASFAEASENSILISHWDFNEGSGTIVHDSIGGYNGTLSGRALWGNGYMDSNSDGANGVNGGYAQTGVIPKTKNFTLIISVSFIGNNWAGNSAFLHVNNGFNLTGEYDSD